LRDKPVLEETLRAPERDKVMMFGDFAASQTAMQPGAGVMV
jgi:hypothetical protein